MVKIILENDVFVTTNTGIVDTPIHIEDKGFCFPSSGWTDFTFPVLEWWKNNLIGARHAANYTFRLPFQDGPFWLDVYKDAEMNLKIECVNDRTPRKIELTTYCTYYEFLEEIQRAIKKFAKILYKNNMNEGDFSSIYRQSILSIAEIENILVSQMPQMRPES